MKRLFSAAALSVVLAFSAASITPAFAAPKKIDRNSEEHKKWKEEFAKKHNIKAKKDAKKPAKKK
jgi:hypothetical protein